MLSKYSFHTHPNFIFNLRNTSHNKAEIDGSKWNGIELNGTITNDNN